MTALSDRLVQVAAEAIHNYECGCGGPPDLIYKRHARIALAAAFAALPESMKAEVVGNDDDRLRAEGWNECLAALAREFGEPTNG